MKVKKLTMLAVLIGCMAAAFAGGCSIGEQTGEEFLTEKNAIDQVVTYYANGGYFNSKDSIVSKDMYYPVNAYVIVDFENTSNISIERSGGYIFDGWYFVETDDGGNPVFEDEANKIYKLTDEMLSANYRIQAYEHLYVAAKWSLDYRLDVVLVSDGAATDSSGKTFESGDVVTSIAFNSNGTYTLTDTSPWASTDYTFLQYYLDEDCTQPYNGETFIKPTGDDAENPKVYAKYVEGVWTVVKTASQVRTMYNNSESETAYYIFDNIDCSSIELMFNPGQFNLTIEGNGHTLSGLTFKLSNISGNDSYALFGDIGENASVRNLTLSDVTVTVTVKTGTPSLYLICYGKEGENDCFENFVLDGAQVNISYPEGYYINNIQKNSDGVYESDNWIYGGIKDENGNETDEAFLSEFGGITIKNAVLTVNKEVVDAID